MSTEKLLQQIKYDTNRLLQKNLVGIYLHGSFVLGGYNPNRSDLDFLIVVKQSLTQTEKMKLMEMVIKKWQHHAPQKGLEFHVMTVKMLEKSSVLPAFDFHYSPMHKADYLKKPHHFVNSMQGFDYDLPAHLKIIQKKGLALYGKSPKKLIPYISNRSYWQSIYFDLKDARVRIYQEPVSVILNLCRSLIFLQTQQILGKLTGGKWAISMVKPQFQIIIRQAIIDYQSDSSLNENNYSQLELQEFADFMLTELEKMAAKKLL